MSDIYIHEDIWREILAYLVVDYDGSEYFTGRRIRKTILNVALANSSLSDVALSALWRNKTSLKDLVHVVNASSPERLLYYSSLVRKGIWILRKPQNMEEVRLRVQSYLCRIRRFSVVHADDKETALWCTLAKLLDNSKPLLSGLRELIVGFKNDCACLNQRIMPLLPKSFKLLSDSPTSERHSWREHSPNPHVNLELYRLLPLHKVELEVLSYCGDVCDDFLSAIASLKSLRSLTLIHKDESKHINRQHKVNVWELLQQLPSLTSLSLNLCPSMSPSTTGSTNHGQLRELEIRICSSYFVGNPPPFLNFKCPDLQILKITMHDTSRLYLPTLFEQVAATFPFIESLQIEFDDKDSECSALRLHDIEVLFSRHITCLQLENIPYQLDTDELNSMIKAWPDIRCLSLTGPGPSFDPSALIALSKLRCLENLSLQVDCMHLLNSGVDSLQKPRNTVTVLCLVRPTWTSTLENAYTIARKLRWFFPVLRRIDAEGAVISDLIRALNVLDASESIGNE